MKRLQFTITAILLLFIAMSFGLNKDNYYIHCSENRVWSVYTNLNTGITYHQYCIGNECITQAIEGSPAQIQNQITAICLSHNQ
tara:strand:+ start:2056 stop:2307 length:252 start_codon:yes stop_codon:yes gene_type:complete